jgi:hypothetical protein
LITDVTGRTIKETVSKVTAKNELKFLPEAMYILKYYNGNILIKIEKAIGF